MLLHCIFNKNNEVCSNKHGEIYIRGTLVLWSSHLGFITQVRSVQAIIFEQKINRLRN